MSDSFDWNGVLTVRSLDSYHGEFRRIAEQLLLRTNIFISSPSLGDTPARFRILEIEFYLWDPPNHKDPFCHRQAVQTQPARWYFHRAGKPAQIASDVNQSKRKSAKKPSVSDAGGYRGGTRKGLDISFGVAPEADDGEASYGGILLRAICRCKSRKPASSSSGDELDRLASKPSQPSRSPKKRKERSDDSPADRSAGRVMKSPYFPRGSSSRSASSTRSSESVIREDREEELEVGGEVDDEDGGDFEIIQGPSTIVDHILRLNGARNTRQLVEDLWGGDISIPSASSTSDPRPHRMWLEPTPELYTKPPDRKLAKDDEPPSTSTPSFGHIYSSPRIGLDLSHSSLSPSDLKRPTLPDRVTFLPKPYRFFRFPNLLTANGRAHTLLGVYDHLITANIRTDLGAVTTTTENDEYVFREAASITGISSSTVNSYLGSYLHAAGAGAGGGRSAEGGEKGIGAPAIPRLEDFVGSKGKGAGSSPARWMVLIGALRRELRLEGQA